MRFRICAALAAIIVATHAASGQATAADVLRPMEARSTLIGERAAVVYYVAKPAGYDVVVTFAALSPDSGASMRSVITLLPGQRQVLSIGGEAGCSPASLEIAREGDSVSISGSGRVGDQASLQ
jgi:hypothetical protein